VHVRLSVYVIAILVGLPIGGVVVPSSAFEPGWGTAVSLKIGGGDALYPQVAVDPRGNAIVLWFQYDENPSDGADGNLWAARFTPLEGWGAPVIVSRLNALTADGQSGWYRVATDSRGNTFAIWVDHERATHLSTVLASRFVPEAGWGPSESFDESDVGGAGVGGPPQIAFDGQGNAIAVWTKGSDTAASRYVLDVGWDQATQVGVPYEGGTCDIGFGDAGDAVLACWSARERGHLVWASRYVAGIGWEAPTILDPAPFGHWIDLAVDPAGNALVAWQVWNVSTRRSSMSLSRYTAGVGWGAASLIEAVGSENLTGPMVAADSRGGALAVWAEGRDPWNLGERVFALRYTPGAGWGVPETITLGAVPVGRPHLAGTASGEAVAAWIHRDGDWASVWGVPFDPDTGWGNPLRIGPEFTVRDVYPDSEELYGLSSPPRVAMDSSGNAFVVWDQFDGAQHNIWANRFEPTLGWGAAQLLEGDNAGRALIPRVAGNARGDAVAVWYQTAGGIEHILANAYTAQDQTPPPLTLEGPAEGTLTNRSALWVSGRTEPGALASVNGVEAFVAANGSFGLTVALAPGPNALKVAARDASGNEATAWVNVTFEDPVPGIEARLRAAEGALAAAQADLAASRARLAEAEAEGNATQAELAAARADLASAEANVDLLESALNSTRADVALVGSELQNASVRLLVVEGEASALKGDQALAQARERELSAALQLTTAVATAGFALALGALAVIAAATRAKGREPGGKP